MAMTPATANLNATLCFSESIIVEAKANLAEAHNAVCRDNGPHTLRELKRVKLLVDHAISLLEGQATATSERDRWRRLLD